MANAPRQRSRQPQKGRPPQRSVPAPPLSHLTVAARYTLCGVAAGGTPPDRAIDCEHCNECAKGRMFNFQRVLSAWGS